MKEQPMRWVLGSLMVLALAPPALAADLDFLRGSQPAPPIAPVTTVGPATFTRWSGFYVGGDISYNSANVDFSGATQPLLGFSLRNTLVEEQLAPSKIQLLGKGASSAPGGGAFLGYNTQWQDLILGVEGNYTHTSFSVTSPSSPPVSYAVSAGNVTSFKLSNAQGHFELTDYAEARGRAGYIVGNLLPYGFVGFVVGVGNYSTSATVDLTCGTSGDCLGYPSTTSAGQSNALLWGVSVGGGLDWAVTQNVFLRGEFEFVQFAPIASISVPIVSGRVGAGFKF